MTQMTSDPTHNPLLSAIDLTKHFRTPGGLVRAVDGVSFDIGAGETVGLVGESGCGKSTVGRTVLKLIEPTAGQLLFMGQDIFRLDRKARRAIRREMGIVFQDPYSALNPRMKIHRIVGEPLKTHQRMTRTERRERVMALLESVGMKGEHADRFPHQFSGGQRQRIAIARSLALNPRFLIFDESTSALDVSVQAQVLKLIRDLQRDKGLAYLFITHDLHVVHLIADRIIVMYLGRLVETGPVEAVFDHPLHPYTRALLAAVPVPDPEARGERILLEGETPSPIDLPAGCRFHTRCPLVEAVCRDEEPDLREMGGGRRAACHLATP